MKQIRDVIVIGSGMIGSAIALAVSRAGTKRVTLIDKGPLVSGMTRRSPGLAHPFQAHPLLCELANSSFEFYNRWAMQLGGKNPFVTTGAAAVDFPNAEASAQFALWKEHVQNASGIAPNALQTLYPDISKQFRAAMFTPHAGYADAVLTAQAFVNAAKERGLDVQTGTQVKQIAVQGRQILGVKTTTGDIEAPDVIVAAGGWSERLLAALGVVLPLRLQRAVIAFYEQPPSVTNDLPMLIDASGAHFVRPHPYRMSAAGWISTDANFQNVDALDEYVLPNEYARVQNFLTACLPEFANTRPKRAHTVLYETCADGLPALGRVGNFDGLYIAAGFGASAFAVAPAVGESVMQMLVDGDATRDISSFHPQRVTLNPNPSATERGA